MNKSSYLESLFYEDDFENFKSNICHYLKVLGDRGMLSLALSEQWIPIFMAAEMWDKGLYTLALTDYLETGHGLKLFPDYEKYREMKLPVIIYPRGVLTLDAVSDEDEKQKALKNAENSPIGRFFIKYNIIEDDIRNVV